VGADKDKLAAAKAAASKQQGDVAAGVVRLGDGRRLQDIGVKMPLPTKKRGSKGRLSRGEDAAAEPDASFLPRPSNVSGTPPSPNGGGGASLEDDAETATEAPSGAEDGGSVASPLGTATSGDGVGTAADDDEAQLDPKAQAEAQAVEEAAAAAAAAQAEADDPGVVIEIEEEDEVGVQKVHVASLCCVRARLFVLMHILCCRPFRIKLRASVFCAWVRVSVHVCSFFWGRVFVTKVCAPRSLI
jgi:hypothetical protein